MKNNKNIIFYFLLQVLTVIPFFCVQLQASVFVIDGKIVRDDILQAPCIVHLIEQVKILKDPDLIEEVMSIVEHMYEDIVQVSVAYFLLGVDHGFVDLKGTISGIVIKSCAKIVNLVYSKLVDYVNNPNIKSYDKLCQLIALLVFIIIKVEMEKKIGELVESRVKIF